MKRSLNHFARSTLACAAICLMAQSYGQVNFRIIHHFGSGGDGQMPCAATWQSLDGKLYGTTIYGGTNGYGTVFKLNTDGSDYKVIYNFSGDRREGTNPQADLVQDSDGVLYGTTTVNSVFKVNTNGDGYAVLGSGTGCSGTLVLGRDGALYGTSWDGGSNNVGTVFRLNTDGAGFTVLYNFSTNVFDGRYPYPGLIQATDGALYGSTALGGSNNAGTLFKLNANGDGYAVLHSFGSSGDGRDPEAKLMQGRDGMLYGTTYGGGSNNVGMVFRLNTDGSNYVVLYSFTTTGGQGRYPAPVALLQRTDGMLYGTTQSGGDSANGCSRSPYATVFRLNTNGADYAVLYRLGYYYSVDGAGPCVGLMQGIDGAFYGTTMYGGLYGNGILFQLTVIPSKFTSSALLPDRTFQLSLSGVSNATYRIDASTDLVNWLMLTNILNATGTVRFVDLEAPNFSQRFYRAAWVP